MRAKVWTRGPLVLGAAAILRLFFGVLFAWMMLHFFGADQAGQFWATAVAYQIGFSLSGFGLPYGVVHKLGSSYSLEAPQVRTAAAVMVMTMAVLFIGLWLVLDRDLQGISVGLHFLVNRMVFILIFFRRNALKFEKALLTQISYDGSIALILLVAWWIGMPYETFLDRLVFLNLFWAAVAFKMLRIRGLGWPRLLASLRYLFRDWRRFSGKTYLTEIIGIVVNGVDRMVIMAMGYTDILAVYVLVRKFYEVPHNVMVMQSSFIFAIMSKLQGKAKDTTKMKTLIVLGYEIIAALGYGLLAVVFIGFGALSLVVPASATAQGLLALFLLIGFAQVSTIPVLNLTYAEGNSRLILNYTIANAVLGGAALLLAYLRESFPLVLLSQNAVALTSWVIMAIFIARDIRTPQGVALASGKALALIALQAWIIHGWSFGNMAG